MRFFKRKAKTVYIHDAQFDRMLAYCKEDAKSSHDLYRDVYVSPNYLRLKQGFSEPPLDRSWEHTGIYRVVMPNGAVRSNEYSLAEARKAAEEGDIIEEQFTKTDERWADIDQVAKTRKAAEASLEKMKKMWEPPISEVPKDITIFKLDEETDGQAEEQD